MHNSRNSLNWAGVYAGTLPCADCPGIQTRLTLGNDGTFEKQSRYLDRDAGLMSRACASARPVSAMSSG